MPTFQTLAPITVIADILSGELTVRASDRTDTVVQVNPADPSKKADVRAAEQTRVDFTGGTLTVKASKDWRTHTPFGGNPSIEVLIEVPTGSLLTAGSGVGRLVAVGEFADTDLEVAAGDITVERPRGAVSAKVAKGDIHIHDAAAGELRLETSYGELEIGIAAGSAVQLEVNATSGTVQNLMQPVDPTNAETVRVHARNSFGNIIIRHAVLV
ncbi:DUF4097 family beta strand repeat-containing protein [Nocardia altamirensis]|uniref:DUF4097 family beta strand repeat-containing protein n=1 Tax=Nocardia altamirensis TaxID=472158 RepID=UPI00083FFD3C|nr:DUF4097 family beta strand repeat-containing protein [Nocardia altamirensis]